MKTYDKVHNKLVVNNFYSMAKFGDENLQRKIRRKCISKKIDIKLWKITKTLSKDLHGKDIFKREVTS